MRGNQVSWLLLLAVILGLLCAIQCPSSPKRITKSLKSFRNSIVRTLSRSRSGSSSRSGQSGSGGAGDEHSGSESDMEPASGNYWGSGSGRLPRSRSPSPPVGGGGRASSSSSSNEPAIARMHGAISAERINNMCQEVNNRGDAHVVTNMQVSVFTNIISEMQQVAANDECKTPSRGSLVGSTKCQKTYVEFKKIPAQYRGECSDAVAASCQVWHVAPSTQRDGDRICSFFVKTGMRTAARIDGYWVTMADCINGIKNELFMDRQLSSLRINPPRSPPQPLLPYNYSPDH